MLAFPYYTTSELLFMGLALTGMFFGSFSCLTPAAVADFFGLKNLGVNFGMTSLGFGLAGLFGPLVGGRVYDWFGSFNRAFIVFTCMLLITPILGFLLMRMKQKT